MQAQDPHRLHGLRRIIAILISALFAVLGVVGYQQTGDALQLLLFIGIAALSWGVVYLLFAVVGRILDSLENKR